jgi:hypothetical protein
MRGHSFPGSLLFAVVAALGAVAWILAARPFFGTPMATALYAILVVLVYVVAIADSWSRGVRIALLAGAVMAVLALALRTPAGLLVGAAATLALTRSGFLYRSKPARALLVEVALVVGGLLFARALLGPSPLGLALAVWGFFLIQSIFFLVGGVRRRQPDPPPIDPFEQARKRVHELMNEPVS